MSKVLYILVIPEKAQTEGASRVTRNITSLGSVGGGSSYADSISSNPDQKTITGWYRGLHADEMALELEELFGAEDISEVPLRSDSGTIADRGYYELEDVNSQSPDPRIAEARKFDGRLVKKGTRSSHWRAVETTTNQIDNDFGNATTGYIGVPATATKVRWFNAETNAREQPTLVATRNAEHGDVEIYDAEAASFADPTMIYDLPYDDEGWVDVRVWDDYGAAKDTTDPDGTTYQRWRFVFDTRHNFEGNPRTDNGLLRVQWDEANNAINAEEWNDGTSSWDSLSLGTQSSSSWQLYDFDLTEISMAEIRMRVEFEDTSTSPNSYYSLDGALKRGYNGIQWMVPTNETPPTPSGLVSYLTPIANTSVIDPQETKTLASREEVRK